jgi:hypothetical protein
MKPCALFRKCLIPWGSYPSKAKFFHPLRVVLQFQLVDVPGAEFSPVDLHPVAHLGHRIGSEPAASLLLQVDGNKIANAGFALEGDYVL